MQWSFEKDLWLVGSWAAARIQNDPGISQLDVAGIFRFNYFPAKNADVKVLRLFLVSHREKVCGEKAFVCNRSIGQIHACLQLSIEETVCSGEHMQSEERVIEIGSADFFM